MTINKDLSTALNTTNDNVTGGIHDGMIPLLLVTLSEKYNVQNPNAQVHSQHLSSKLKVSLVRMNQLLHHLEKFSFITRVTAAKNNDISYNIKLAPSDLPLIVKFGLMGLKKLRQKNQQTLSNDILSNSVSIQENATTDSVSADFNVSEEPEEVDEDTFEDFDIDDSFNAKEETLNQMTESFNDFGDKSEDSQSINDLKVSDDESEVSDDYEPFVDDSIIENDRVTQLQHHDEHYLNNGFESSSFLHWLDTTFYIHRHFQANEQNCNMSSFLKNEDAKLLYDVCLKRNLQITMTDLSKAQLLQFIDMQFQVYQSFGHV